MFIFIPFSISLYFLEAKLRSRNNMPGVLVQQPAAPFFTLVDSLEVVNELIADSSGIIHVNKEIWDKYSWAKEPGNFVNDFGFRSRPFVNKAENKQTSILFLGDSFTWGYDAAPLTNSFVDKIQAQGYITFNSGIADTDPVQYFLVAKKFIPILNPDFCFVILFLGNDIMTHDRPVKPLHPKHWTTNAGALPAYRPAWNWKDGCDTDEAFLTANDAYEYFIRVHTILGNDVGIFEKTLSKTSVGTAFYTIFKMHKKATACPPEDRNFTAEYLSRIDSICEMHDVEFRVFVIPGRDDLPMSESKFKDEYKNLLINAHFQIPENLKESDYSDDAGGHFNNSGHKKFSEFILEFLQKHSKRS